MCAKDDPSCPQLSGPSEVKLDALRLSIRSRLFAPRGPSLRVGLVPHNVMRRQALENEWPVLSRIVAIPLCAGRDYLIACAIG